MVVGDGVDPMELVCGQYDTDELAIAEEFLTTWLPFLFAGTLPLLHWLPLQPRRLPPPAAADTTR